MGCAVTGGVDSRSVLAHLLANGVRPALTVTGPPDHPDVCLAGKIADVLGQELTVFSDAPEGDAWLQEAIRQADGMAGVCGAYRLAKQSGGLAARGIALKFGGGAGELYKNSFLNQDFPFYGGKPDWKRFLRFKVITYDFPDGICGGQTEEAIRQTPEPAVPPNSAGIAGPPRPSPISAPAMPSCRCAWRASAIWRTAFTRPIRP